MERIPGINNKSNFIVSSLKPISLSPFTPIWGLLGLQDTTMYGNLETIAKIFNNHDLNLKYHSTDELYKDTKRRPGERKREPIIVFQEAVRNYQEIIEKITFYYWEDHSKIKGLRNNKQKNEFRKEVIGREDFANQLSERDKQRAKEIFSKESQSFNSDLNFNKMLSDVHPQIFVDSTNHSRSTGWYFKSLLSAIYLRVFLDLKEGNKIIHCRWRKCNKLFIPNRQDNQHCSDACKDNDKTDRANQRKWLIEALAEFNTYPSSQVEQLFISLILEGYSGKVTILNEIRKRL